MRIAVLSGKGGTGKTLVSVNLATVAKTSIYIDCDVEEPNGHLFFKPEGVQEEEISVQIPKVDEELCNGCRKCVDFCNFNALAYVKNKLLVFDDVCHSCGGCILVCPEKALTEKAKGIGKVQKGVAGEVTVWTGILNIGEATGIPIIKNLLAASGSQTDQLTFIDCPPGSACIVMESMKDADYCVLVAEPTLFGVHNLNMVCGLAFFLFIGGEYVVPLTKEVKNAKRNIPLGMILSMIIIFCMQTFLTLGFKNYTEWGELGASTTPHVLYGQLLLGPVGKYWMVIASLLAVISSVNTIMASLSYILMGMSKIELLPNLFQKKNKKGAPYVGIIIQSIAFCIINITGLSTTDSLSFLISVLALLWMLSYIVSNLNVLLLRKRLPNAPRTFKVPFGPVIPIIGMVGTAWMIYNIDPNWEIKLQLYKVCGIMILLLTIYAFFWVKFKVKRSLFKPYPVKEVMAMENDRYQKFHKSINKDHMFHVAEEERYE